MFMLTMKQTTQLIKIYDIETSWIYYKHINLVIVNLIHIQFISTNTEVLPVSLMNDWQICNPLRLLMLKLCNPIFLSGILDYSLYIFPNIPIVLGNTLYHNYMGITETGATFMSLLSHCRLAVSFHTNPTDAILHLYYQLWWPQKISLLTLL